MTPEQLQQWWMALIRKEHLSFFNEVLVPVLEAASLDEGVRNMSGPDAIRAVREAIQRVMDDGVKDLPAEYLCVELGKLVARDLSK